jgi:hypothetical protein
MELVCVFFIYVCTMIRHRPVIKKSEPAPARNIRLGIYAVSLDAATRRHHRCTYLNVFAYVCMSACMHVCFNKRLHRCVYACIYVCMYACSSRGLHACKTIMKCVLVTQTLRKGTVVCTNTYIHSRGETCLCAGKITNKYMHTCIHADETCLELG